MTKNPNLAKGYHKNEEKVVIKEQWNTIKDKLNSIGPPSRDSEGWMKVWADMKTSVKKKLVFNKQQNCATGGGPFRQKALTALDEAVPGLLQLDSIINPKPVTFGIQNATSSRNKETHESEETIDCVETHDSLEANEEDGNSNGSGDNTILEQSRVRKTKRHSKASENQSLLQQQLKIQSDLYNDVKKSLSEIERYTRRTYKVREEELKIKKEKLQLYKEEIKKKEKLKSAMLKLRMEEIELEKRRIEIEENRMLYS